MFREQFGAGDDAWSYLTRCRSMACPHKTQGSGMRTSRARRFPRAGGSSFDRLVDRLPSTTSASHEAHPRLAVSLLRRDGIAAP